MTPPLPEPEPSRLPAPQLPLPRLLLLRRLVLILLEGALILEDAGEHLEGVLVAVVVVGLVVVVAVDVDVGVGVGVGVGVVGTFVFSLGHARLSRLMARPLRGLKIK